MDYLPVADDKNNNAGSLALSLFARAGIPGDHKGNYDGEYTIRKNNPAFEILEEP